MNPIFPNIKYKSITFYIKKQKRTGAYIIVSKGALHFKYVSKG